MKSLYFALLISCTTFAAFSQSKELPYREIPEAPAEYTPGTVAARMVDGLGFRFYWATEGLRPEDLAYKPGSESRTSLETIQHIYSLSIMIAKTAGKEPILTLDESTTEFSELRAKTLTNLELASKALRVSKTEDFEEHQIVFGEGEQATTYPFWNLINGPIADAIWHTGQVVSFRRTSGNPFNSKVSVFNGKLRE